MKFFKYSFLILSISLSACIGLPTATQAPHKPGTQLNFSDCIEGMTRQGFLQPSTSGDAPCVSGTQTCVSRQWVGPMLYDYCDNFSKSCGGYPHGSVMTGYLQPSSPSGVPCTPATKTCINGMWTGPEVYPYCNQLP